MIILCIQVMQNIATVDFFECVTKRVSNLVDELQDLVSGKKMFGFAETIEFTIFLTILQCRIDFGMKFSTLLDYVS